MLPLCAQCTGPNDQHCVRVTGLLLCSTVSKETGAEQLPSLDSVVLGFIVVPVVVVPVVTLLVVAGSTVFIVPLPEFMPACGMPLFIIDWSFGVVATWASAPVARPSERMVAVAIFENMDVPPGFGSGIRLMPWIKPVKGKTCSEFFNLFQRRPSAAQFCGPTVFN
jgi:hypothetical protein